MVSIASRPSNGSVVEESDILNSLADRLWDERQVVTYLLFKLTVTKLLLSAEDRRFLPDVLTEVDHIVASLRDHEERRAKDIERLAELWNVDSSTVTIAMLADRARAPFDTIFADHHEAFTSLAVDIDAVGRQNRALARSRIGEVAATIELLTGDEQGPVATYDASGEVAGSRGAQPTVFREAL